MMEIQTFILLWCQAHSHPPHHPLAYATHMGYKQNCANIRSGGPRSPANFEVGTGIFRSWSDRQAGGVVDGQKPQNEIMI